MSRPGSTTSDGRITVTPAAEVTPDDDVRHFDQLPETAKRAVIEAGEGRSTPAHALALASTGVDVVVFTDYYRVR
jgi:hypothetical protein